jgi:hypothetical protein
MKGINQSIEGEKGEIRLNRSRLGREMGIEEIDIAGKAACCGTGADWPSIVALPPQVREVVDAVKRILKK